MPTTSMVVGSMLAPLVTDSDTLMASTTFSSAWPDMGTLQAG